MWLYRFTILSSLNFYDLCDVKVMELVPEQDEFFVEYFMENMYMGK